MCVRFCVLVRSSDCAFCLFDCLIVCLLVCVWVFVFSCVLVCVCAAAFSDGTLVSFVFQGLGSPKFDS